MKSRTALTALQARAKAAAERTPQARVTTSPHGGAESTSRELWLYGTVGGYWWGFDAADVAETLRGMGEDVDEILVRLHSFGGNAIEGIAIANLLANHPATVRVVVDGIAASAASVIALAGSELVMSPGSQMMIHDPYMLTVGNAAELRAEAEWLESQARNYAETYAHRAGHDAAHWREVMTANNGDGTWYSAAETVEAGLADRVENIASTTPPPAAPSLDDLDDEDLDFAAAIEWDTEVLLSPAARAAMRRAGAPKPPIASADGSTHTHDEETAMAFTPEQLNTMRQELGLAESADEATIVSALSEALAEQAEESPAASTPTVPEGMALVEQTVLDELRAAGEEGRAARRQQLEDHRDRTIAAAIESGRIAPARREHYEAAWAADAEGTEQLLASLAPGLVPVAELGHSGDVETKESAYDDSALSAFADTFGISKEALQ